MIRGHRLLMSTLFVVAVLGALELGLASETSVDSLRGSSHDPLGCTKTRIIFDASGSWGTMDGGGLRCIGAHEAPCGNSF